MEMNKAIDKAREDMDKANAEATKALADLGLDITAYNFDDLHARLIAELQGFKEFQTEAIAQRMQALENDSKMLRHAKDLQSFYARLCNAFHIDTDGPEVSHDELIKQALALSNKAENHENTIMHIQKALGFNAPGLYDAGLIVMHVKKRHDDLEAMKERINAYQRNVIADIHKITQQCDAFAHILTDYVHKPAVRDVMAERERQVNSRGMTSERDDEYAQGVLASSAAAYANPDLYEFSWRFASDSFKPSDVRKNWVKAAAMIVAEIEKYDRAQAIKDKAADDAQPALGPTQLTAQQLRNADRAAGATGRAVRHKRWEQRDGATRPDEQ